MPKRWATARAGTKTVGWIAIPARLPRPAYWHLQSVTTDAIYILNKRETCGLQRIPTGFQSKILSQPSTGARAFLFWRVSENGQGPDCAVLPGVLRITVASIRTFRHARSQQQQTALPQHTCLPGDP